MMEYSKDVDLIIIATTADKHLSIIKICAKYRPKKSYVKNPWLNQFMSVNKL